MNYPVYDVCVVGAGLMGSSAARHVTQLDKRKKVILIGPKEPEDRNATDIFGAHYDEARIVCGLFHDPIWAKLRQTALLKNRDTERESGVTFYSECGYMKVAHRDSEERKQNREGAKASGAKFVELEHEESRLQHPYFDIRPDEIAIWVKHDAGIINPRKLLKAQLILAKRNGCVVVHDVVNSVIPAAPSLGDLYQVITDQGHVYLTRNVLLATGTFTPSRNLLPRTMLPDMYCSKQTVIFVEVSEDDVRKRLASMPCIIVSRVGDEIPVSFYTMAPIRYPDGKYYMKIGHGEEDRSEARTPEETAAWYRGRGDPEKARHLIKSWHELYPGLKALTYVTDSCITCKTKHGKPYIDMVLPGLAVAIGGNGIGANAADEIGNIAARLILKGSWDHELPREAFRYHAISQQKPSKL